MLHISVGLLLITLVAGTENCINGTIFPAGDGCNSCLCLKNRTLLCTQRDCMTVSNHRIKKRQIPEVKKRECTPGKPFIPDGDCNYCLCTKDGQNTHACTMMFCYEFRSAMDEPCPSKGVFMSKDGCNKCRCDRHNFARCAKKKCVN